MKTLRELYVIGSGPSSSHTIGPEKASNYMLKKYPNANKFVVTLFGSLALTGKGHLTDYIICGGALESHDLKKEVNFSDTLIYENELCRIPGNIKGLKWSGINAHGWFSYEIKVKPNCENTVNVLCGSVNGKLDVKITIDGVETEIREEIFGKKWLTFNYLEKAGKEKVEIRIDKISANVPLIFKVEVR